MGKYKNTMKKYIFKSLILIISFLIVPIFCFAFYPNDAITIPFAISGETEITLLEATTTPRTILNAHIINYANSINEGSYIDCGNHPAPFTRLAKAYYTQGYDDRMMTFLCQDVVIAGSSGPINAYGQIVYVNYDLKERIEENLKTALIKNETTGAEFYVEKTLTYGEAMILWFLTLFAFILIFKIAYNFFWGK